MRTKTVIQMQCENCHHYYGLKKPIIGKNKILCSYENGISIKELEIHSEHCAAQHIKDWDK